MKDLLVVLSCSGSSGLSETYRQQLTDAGIEFSFNIIGEIPNANSGGCLEYKLEMLRQYCRRFYDYERLIFSDVWDVLFYGRKEDVIRKIPLDRMIQGAERACYPEYHLGGLIRGVTPWRYANGGFQAGSPQAILEWCDRAQESSYYAPEEIDQRFLNRLLAYTPEMVALDSKTQLVYCLAGEAGELEFVRGMPRNTLCDTWPNFLHFNGRFEHGPILKMREASL